MAGAARERERTVSVGTEFEQSKPRRADGASLLLKRLFDMAIAAVLLLALSPVLAVTALVVWATLGRPLMFRQERCGKGQQTFVVNKFRTMSDARDAQGSLRPDDLRQTSLTAFLRRIRVDELPQLFAVMHGDMSFVGPRPLLPAAITELGFRGELRCSIAPGMTGWAQVNGNTLLSTDQKIALDIWYIDRRSMLLDVQIVFMTLRTILRGEKVDAKNVATALAHLERRLFRPNGSPAIPRRV